MIDTIFAVSSGTPPAAIAVVRVSGPAAIAATTALAGPLPPPRMAQVRALRDPAGELLDRALVLVFPGPDSATGEDVVELHVHGGRAVVAAVEGALGAMPSLRCATAGEFTRRALFNGRIDLAQAQGLGDLLRAENETMRRAAIDRAEGHLSRLIGEWLTRLTAIAAQIEAEIDFSDEDDVASSGKADVRAALAALREDMERGLSQPTIEQLEQGCMIVLAGAPNVGKSTLFNMLIGRDQAIVSPIAGTTRDRVETRVVRDGRSFHLIDTAGLHSRDTDAVEVEGMTRARRAIEAADLLLWLDDDPPPVPERSLWLWPRADVRVVPPGERLPVSQRWPNSIDKLWRAIAKRTSAVNMQGVVFDNSQQAKIGHAAYGIREAVCDDDPLIMAEWIRVSQRELGAIIGVDVVDETLNAVFQRFCIGK